MSENENLPGTQVVETPNEGQDNQDSYFLTIDDRTRYKTQEEAQKAYQESGKRIAELTPWQKMASDYGVRSPEELSQLFDELIEARVVRQQAESKPKGAEASPQPGAGTNLTPEEQKAAKEQEAGLKWLKENGVKAGYITSDQLESVQAMLDEFHGFREETEQARFQSHIEEGRTYLGKTLEDMGIKFASDDLKKGTLNLLEKALTTWINEDDNRIAAFHQGGAALDTLIKQGLEESAPILNVLKNQQAANYAAQKQGNAGRPGQRPAAKPAAKSGQKENQPKPKNKLDNGEDFTSDVHNAAWEAMQRAQGRSQ